jgi:Tat protein secretion system quality control protein TatD with DNase activity
VGTAVQSHYSIKVKDMDQDTFEIAKRAVENHIKERLIEEITKLQDFDRLMKIKESVEIWAKTKI